MVTESFVVWPSPFSCGAEGWGVGWRSGGRPGDWRPLSVFLLCAPGSQSWAIFCSLGSQRSRPRPRRASCLELSFVGDRTACSLNKQIHRCEPIWGCHVFPDEIPDLVCCVFLKTRPLPPKTSAWEEKYFSSNYQGLKWCQIMPHLSGLDGPVFPSPAFPDGPRWQGASIVWPALALYRWEN